MRRAVILSLVLLFSFVGVAKAQSYEITSFHTDMEIHKDTRVEVVETIQADFNISKHGIYRFMPIQYRSGVSNITLRVTNITVTDDKGTSIPFTKSVQGRDLRLKIGDPNKTLTGIQTYLIHYTLDGLIRRYDTHDEVYWNVVGSNWDTTVYDVSYSLSSEYADITGATCFTGPVGGTEQLCEVGHDSHGVIASSNTSVTRGEDFTVVAIIDSNNMLVYPGFLTKSKNFVLDNWGYAIAIAPLLFFAFRWYKKGRDITYGDLLYYGEEENMKLKPLFARPHLPTVYTPIDGVSPAQIGTLVDEKVDTKDIVAEIVELARLGFLTIKQDKKNYELTSLKKDREDLADYQVYLLESLFPIGSGETVNTKDFKKLKFYTHLPNLKKKIYNSVTKTHKLFDGNPDTVRAQWITFAIFSAAPVMILLSRFVTFELNPFVYITAFVSTGVATLFASQMPRKTADGYALARDITGLKNYLKIGKWRHEVYEKNLFLEEMIPIAISLGIVDALAKQMKDLGLPAPKYFNSASGAINLNSFQRSLSSSVVAGATQSSSGGWSGGSGSSGGFSGGGFGGGGGGSW